MGTAVVGYGAGQRLMEQRTQSVNREGKKIKPKYKGA